MRRVPSARGPVINAIKGPLPGDAPLTRLPPEGGCVRMTAPTEKRVATVRGAAGHRGSSHGPLPVSRPPRGALPFLGLQQRPHPPPPSQVWHRSESHCPNCGTTAARVPPEAFPRGVYGGAPHPTAMSRARPPSPLPSAMHLWPSAPVAGHSPCPARAHCVARAAPTLPDRAHCLGGGARRWSGSHTTIGSECVGCGLEGPRPSRSCGPPWPTCLGRASPERRGGGLQFKNEVRTALAAAVGVLWPELAVMAGAGPAPHAGACVGAVGVWGAYVTSGASVPEGRGLGTLAGPRRRAPQHRADEGRRASSGVLADARAADVLLICLAAVLHVPAFVSPRAR